MSKMMILGVKGEAGLWLVDFGAGTVTALDGKREDYFDRVDGVGGADKSAAFAVGFENREAAFSGQFFEASKAGNVAATFEAREEAFGGFMYRTPPVDVAVAFEPKEAAFSGQFYNVPDGAGSDRSVSPSSTH